MFVILIGDYFCHLKSIASQTVAGQWFSDQLQLKKGSKRPDG
ncbi:hypothetical protein D932_03359 [Enterococcus casseliflavus 14-MB-W-14]|jgi:hypothetical protein|nr:hypothetical protein [Enterococcus casseliflavus]EPH60539.1 hypothetical protein D932_03359 [Enterococcus casseliflavus 14-MB-W-14]